MESFNVLSDDAIASLYLEAIGLVRKLGQNASRKSDIPFIRLIVNFGNYRNLRHLHLKCQLAQEDFEEIRSAWGTDLEKRFQRLMELANDSSVMRGMIGGKLKEPKRAAGSKPSKHERKAEASSSGSNL